MAPAHPLDTPVWSALTSRQSAIALGDDRARRYAAGYAPFAAAAPGRDDGVTALAELLSGAQDTALLGLEAPRIPPGFRVIADAECVQMILEGPIVLAASPGVVRLGDADAPAMAELAGLTRPGPFGPRTHRMGTFIGVRMDGRLVAMAGERMRMDSWSEVSGVCTHPGWRGRGFARALSGLVVRRIRRRGEQPFLHAYASNATAIDLYRSLGFVERARLRLVRIAAP